MFIILDKDYETFCPKLSKHFGRPLRLKKCLYEADFTHLYLLVPNQSMITMFTRKPVTIMEVVVISTSSHIKMIQSVIVNQSNYFL